MICFAGNSSGTKLSGEVRRKRVRHVPRERPSSSSPGPSRPATPGFYVHDTARPVLDGPGIVLRDSLDVSLGIAEYAENDAKCGSSPAAFKTGAASVSVADRMPSQRSIDK